MDFSTIERKLAASNPTKPDANPSNPRYLNVEEYIADVRRVFMNCALFNGPDHAITQMGKRVESVFDKQVKNLPPAEEVSSYISVVCNLMLMFAKEASCGQKAANSASTASPCRRT